MSGTDAIIEGNSDSPVTMVMFEDLQCSDCAVLRLMLDERLLPEYGERVAFEHHDFPLPNHNWAYSAALAARAAARMDELMGIQLRRYFFAYLGQINGENIVEHLRRFSEKSGLDIDPLLAAETDQELRALVEADLRRGKELGVDRTPTVLVNGRTFVETLSASELAEALEDALRSA